LFERRGSAAVRASRGADQPSSGRAERRRCLVACPLGCFVTTTDALLDQFRGLNVWRRGNEPARPHRSPDGRCMRGGRVTTSDVRGDRDAFSGYTQRDSHGARRSLFAPKCEEAFDYNVVCARPCSVQRSSLRKTRLVSNFPRMSRGKGT
jgi:hypothetical protein